MGTCCLVDGCFDDRRVGFCMSSGAIFTDVGELEHRAREGDLKPLTHGENPTAEGIEALRLWLEAKVPMAELR